MYASNTCDIHTMCTCIIPSVVCVFADDVTGGVVEVTSCGVPVTDLVKIGNSITHYNILGGH